MEFNKKEIRHLIIAALIAGFVFSFNEWGIDKFDLTFGIRNFLRAVILSAIIYTFHAIAQKTVGKKSGCNVEFSLIMSNFKFSLSGEKTTKLPSFCKPLGPIITLLVSIISNGKLFFIALASFNLKVNRVKRVGHKWTNIKEFEEAGIACAGPFSNLIALVIFKLLLPFSASFFSKGMFIASTLAIFHLLPFPKFDGLKILIGSRILYLFSIVLAIILISLINFANAFIAIMAAITIAAAMALYFFYKSNK